MAGRLAETMRVDDNDLLAPLPRPARSVCVSISSTAGHIRPERLFLSASTAATVKQNKGPRVFLSLQ